MSQFSTRPLYLQVRDAVAGRIASGEWKPNTAVPNENELARELGVSPGTMRKALDLLEHEGLITRRQGRGTFVNDPASFELATRYNRIHALDGKRIVGDIKVLEMNEAPATQLERERLHLREGELVFRLKRTRAYKGKNYLAEEVALPAALFPKLLETDLCSGGIVKIAYAYGVLLGPAVERISVGLASPLAAENLNLAEGAPIFILDRTIATRDGRPAEWRKAECTMADMHYRVETV